MDWRRRVWATVLKSCKWIPQRPCFRLFSMLKWGSWCNILKPIRPTTFASNMLYHPQHIGRILISAAQMHRQGDLGFSFDTEGSLWSHQSMCSARIQPRRARPRGFHADVVFFFFLLSFFFFFYPIHLLLSRICSHLSSNSVQHRGMNFPMRSNMRYLALKYWCRAVASVVAARRSWVWFWPRPFSPCVCVGSLASIHSHSH